MSEEKMLRKKEMIGFFLQKGALLTPELLEQITEEKPFSELCSSLASLESEAPLILDKGTSQLISSTREKGKGELNWVELERYKVLSEKGKTRLYDHFQDIVNHETPKQKATAQQPRPVRVITPYKENTEKKGVADFIDYFNDRHKKIENMLKGRAELASALSINKLKGKKREEVCIIGMVSNKQLTKNNNIVLVMEDTTGQIKAIVSKNNRNTLNLAKEVIMDEVIGIGGVYSGEVIFVNKIVWPDVPFGERLKGSEEEYFVAFISDIHVGSTHFLPEDFNRFIKWTNGKIGNQAQRHIAEKLRYIFISGDIVDGCGIYPDQEEELLILDVSEQYKECARLLREIPERIHLIVCPGNHDAVRLGEPQPILNNQFTQPISELPNATLVPNPCLVNIGETETFSGFDVMLYHGASFDYFIREVEPLRNNGGYDRADLIMKFLLRKRHLAPTHSSTPRIPGKSDFLVIDTVPDFLASGHIHKSIVSNYRSVTLVSGSCWQSKTKFQEKMGHNPEPSRVPVVNMKTREVKILKFG